MGQGLFITFEGGEGVGKTTQIQRLEACLSSMGKTVLRTREPGGTQVGEVIRGVLLDKQLPDMHEDTELLLMFAARAEHFQRVISPGLAAGKIVLSDRFADASHVYQGAGRGIDDGKIERLERWTLGDFQPDMTFLLDMAVTSGMQRVHQRGECDRFEQEDLAFFENIRQGYLARARKYPERFVVINAAEEIEMVEKHIMTAVKSRLT